MKPAKTLIESMADVDGIQTSGDLRRLIANSLLALARKEISATDVEAMAKGVDAISNSLNAEIKLARTTIELRDKGAKLSNVEQVGHLVIGKPARPAGGDPMPA